METKTFVLPPGQTHWQLGPGVVQNWRSIDKTLDEHTVVIYRAEVNTMVMGSGSVFPTSKICYPSRTFIVAPLAEDLQPRYCPGSEVPLTVVDELIIEHSGKTSITLEVDFEPNVAELPPADGMGMIA